MTNSFFSKVRLQIEKGGEISPFLFLGENLELLHADIHNNIQALFIEKSIDTQSLFCLTDTGETLKIDEVKKILQAGDVKSRFEFQVFFIENISRMTHQAQNACLKFFEEPGEGNIIFLSNSSEAGVLETILSRVQEVKTNHNSNNEKNVFYVSMVSSYVLGSSDELVRYFFGGKFEKGEYVEFLKSIIVYISETGKFTELLDELHEDIGGVLKNNLQGKYITDKYIILLGK